MAGASVADVVAQFRTVPDVIDETAVAAKRAQVEAEQARGAYVPPAAPASTAHPPPGQPPPPAHEAASAITVSVLGAALVGRAAIEYIKRRRNQKEQDDNQK